MTDKEGDNLLQELVVTLRYQSLLLKKIYTLLLSSTAQVHDQDNKAASYQFKARIDDLQLSFDTVANIAFKWWIATLMIGVVFGCITGFLVAVFR